MVYVIKDGAEIAPHFVLVQTYDSLLYFCSSFICVWVIKWRLPEFDFAFEIPNIFKIVISELLSSVFSTLRIKSSFNTTVVLSANALGGFKKWNF